MLVIRFGRPAYAPLAGVIKVAVRFQPMAHRPPIHPAEMLTICEAAALLGVSEPTLRRWDRAKKFPARRHPMNGYRLYVREEIEKLRKRIVGGKAA